MADSHPPSSSRNGGEAPFRGSGRGGSASRRPHKGDFPARGGGGRGGRGGRGGKKRDMGRKEWAKTKVDKRQRNDDEQTAKRQRVDKGEAELPIYATKFSEDVLAAEERKPKKKVAVMLGYAGTGYKGMQLAHDQKTIEGDLFQAFVAAGAISKANADDPKKSSFVRCARTDKGVHAAGNVISLKLIVEDEDIVQKINDNLVPQIRIWGFERTNNSFSAYQMVDSRIYEYLIPTHSFLPPHPSSFLGKNCEAWAEKKSELEAYRKRQEEVAGYWEEVDEGIIKPILADYDEEIRGILEKALWLKGNDGPAVDGDFPDASVPTKDDVKSENADIQVRSEEQIKRNADLEEEADAKQEAEVKQEADVEVAAQPQDSSDITKPSRREVLQEAMKRLRQAYITAKRSYRIPATRLTRIQEALNLYVGTRNYHNYTILKSFSDPSAKRVIKSFDIGEKPIIIDGTEWLSMKVHGQSFMMHQIRKMVGMVALIVRCGADPKLLHESMGPDRLSIPKAPSLGLLLERPIFESYSKRAKAQFDKEPLDFDKYTVEMDRFKQEQIYERMYRDEERENVFGNFFNHVDNFPSETFLFVTSGGYQATQTRPLVGFVERKEPEKGDAEKQLGEEKDPALGVEDEDSDVDQVKDEHGQEG